MEDLDDFIWKERCDILFYAGVQVRYHKRRQRFFDLAEKITNVMTVTAGASIVSQYMNEDGQRMALLVTVLGFFALVFGYGDRKHQHRELAEEASRLVAKIEIKPFDVLTTTDTAEFKSKYSELCGKAPPPMKTLTIMCEYEESVVNGRASHIQNPCFIRRFLSQLLS